jgi:hypothetical protein
MCFGTQLKVFGKEGEGVRGRGRKNLSPERFSSLSPDNCNNPEPTP